MDASMSSAGGSKASKGSRASFASAARKGSLLLKNARMSFVRSGGERGATIENLRGTKGADFEGKADIERVNQAAVGGCGCMRGNGSDSTVVVLIKGPFCFIFSSDKATSPKYAISLANMIAETKAPARGTAHHIVLLETNLGDVEYEVSFEDGETAQAFATTVTEQAAAGEVDIVRKRLGHEHLLTKRASMRFAASIATKKIEDAPDVPVSNEEIIASGLVNECGVVGF